MTPRDLELIEAGRQRVLADPDRFGTRFYDELFAIAPQVRSMFPADLSAQRSKLVGELGVLLAAATDADDPERTDKLVKRLEQLGRRHVGYGATDAMYEPVGAALLAALAAHIPEFDDEHQRAWFGLYGFVAATMQQGAAKAIAERPEILT